MSSISMLAALSFGILTLVWFSLYITKAETQVYVLALVLIIGWLYSIYFTKGFQTVHAFSIMLKYIIVRDITRFLFIYSFVLLGFAFAMHALFQISEPMGESFPISLHSIFTTFNMMIGMDEIFDDDTDDNYSSVNSSSVYLRVTYLVYIILSTIILLNLLIAMMSDTYNDIKSREGTTWRVGSIGMAIRIERSLPLLARMLRALRNCQSSYPIEYSADDKRYYVTVSLDKIRTLTSSADSETKQVVNKLESRLNLMTSDMREMSQQLSDVIALIRGGGGGGGGEGGAGDYTDGRPGSAAGGVAGGARPVTARHKRKLTHRMTKH